jgi:tRNA pseudouridine38-40 synthase
VWVLEGNQLVFHISANRFLRNMVRAIVGTLLNVGVGKIEVAAIHEIIKSEDRGAAGVSVPAQGLYLTKVEYPENIVYVK